MAVEGISNLTQNLADQVLGPTPVPPIGSNSPVGTGNPNSTPVVEDTFTPSAQNNPAQDAGIFQLGQGTRPQVSANILPPQTAANTNQNGAPAQSRAAQTPNGTSAQVAGPAAEAAVQLQLQALNAALPELGLTNAEIQQIDRIASLVQNFNPAAYANLVNQFEAQSQQAAQQGPPNVAANPNAAATSGGTSAGNNGSQTQEVLVHFTGSQGTPNTAPGKGGGQTPAPNNPQNAPAGLQVEPAQFTPTDNTGQTGQTQVSQQNTDAGTPNQQTPQNQVTAI